MYILYMPIVHIVYVYYIYFRYNVCVILYMCVSYILSIYVYSATQPTRKFGCTDTAERRKTHAGASGTPRNKLIECRMYN